MRFSGKMILDRETSRARSLTTVMARPFEVDITVADEIASFDVIYRFRRC